MGDLEDLQKKVIAYRDERDWKQFHNPKDVAITLSLEAIELLELFQWKTPEEVQAYLNDHKEEVADELMDVLYSLLIFANDLNIDITEALDSKMAKNAKKYPVDKAKGNHKKYSDL